MMKINNKEYDVYDIKITWGNFTVCSNGEKITGISPFISFKIDNDIIVGLEFILAREEFENFKLNTIFDVRKYLSDITYEDEKGWVSIISGEYSCNMTKISENNFKLEFSIESNEIDVINIEINTDITLL